MLTVSDILKTMWSEKKNEKLIGFGIKCIKCRKLNAFKVEKVHSEIPFYLFMLFL